MTVGYTFKKGPQQQIIPGEMAPKICPKGGEDWQVQPIVIIGDIFGGSINWHFEFQQPIVVNWSRSFLELDIEFSGKTTDAYFYLSEPLRWIRQNSLTMIADDHSVYFEASHNHRGTVGSVKRVRDRLDEWAEVINSPTEYCVRANSATFFRNTASGALTRIPLKYAFDAFYKDQWLCTRGINMNIDFRKMEDIPGRPPGLSLKCRGVKIHLARTPNAVTCGELRKPYDRIYIMDYRVSHKDAADTSSFVFYVTAPGEVTSIRVVPYIAGDGKKRLEEYKEDCLPILPSCRPWSGVRHSGFGVRHSPLLVFWGFDQKPLEPELLTEIEEIRTGAYQLNMSYKFIHPGEIDFLIIVAYQEAEKEQCRTYNLRPRPSRGAGACAIAANSIKEEDPIEPISKGMLVYCTV